MTTRGTWGYRYKGKDHLMFNRYDSYPEGLGNNIAEEACKCKNLKSLFKQWRKVKYDAKPSQRKLRELGDKGCPVHPKETWGHQCVSSSKYFYGYNYIVEDNEFIKDSLYCEYGYIFNLDDDTLEYYVGYQTKPQKDNRYGCEKIRDFYPCKLSCTIPLSKVKEGYKKGSNFVSLLEEFTNEL